MKLCINCKYFAPNVDYPSELQNEYGLCMHKSASYHRKTNLVTGEFTEEIMFAKENREINILFGYCGKRGRFYKESATTKQELSK